MARRLIIVVPLHKDQSEPVKDNLMNSEGACACGRPLTTLSSKFLLGNINSEYCALPGYRNSILIAAYCYACAGEINDTLKRIKNRGVMDMKPENSRSTNAA